MNFHLDDSKVQKGANERIKVVVLGAFSSHLGVGSGSLTITNQLIKYLAYREDIELHVVTFGDKESCYQHKNAYFRKGSFDLHVIEKPFGYPLSLPLLIWRLRRKIMEIDPDIVHSIGSSVPWSTPAALVRRKYPTVLTVFGVIGREYRFRSSRINVIECLLVTNPNERRVVSKIPHIIIPTSHIQSLISKLTRSKIHVVRDGIEFDKIQGFQPYKGEKPDVLFMSSLSKLKGADVLIRALPMVLNSIPDLTVYIAGAGPQENEFRILVRKLNLESHVKFLGLISDEEEKYSYYKACKIVVAPSRWDCQPYAVTEGAACGKPTIASDSSNPELLEDGSAGFIFESENVKDLADKMTKLLKDDRLREQMGKAALEKARECDWNRIVEQTVKIYREVIEDFHERRV